MFFFLFIVLFEQETLEDELKLERRKLQREVIPLGRMANTLHWLFMLSLGGRSNALFFVEAVLLVVCDCRAYLLVSFCTL